MAYNDPKHRHDQRVRVNLNTYQMKAVEALAELHGKQTASYLEMVIDAHLEKFNFASDNKNIKQYA